MPLFYDIITYSSLSPSTTRRQLHPVVVTHTHPLQVHRTEPAGLRVLVTLLVRGLRHHEAMTATRRRFGGADARVVRQGRKERRRR